MTTIDTSSAVFKDTIMAYRSARQAERPLRLEVHTQHAMDIRHHYKSSGKAPAGRRSGYQGDGEVGSTSTSN